VVRAASETAVWQIRAAHHPAPKRHLVWTLDPIIRSLLQAVIVNADPIPSARRMKGTTKFCIEIADTIMTIK